MDERKMLARNKPATFRVLILHVILLLTLKILSEAISYLLVSDPSTIPSAAVTTGKQKAKMAMLING